MQREAAPLCGVLVSSHVSLEFVIAQPSVPCSKPGLDTRLGPAELLQSSEQLAAVSPASQLLLPHTGRVPSPPPAVAVLVTFCNCHAEVAQAYHGSRTSMRRL